MIRLLAASTLAMATIATPAFAMPDCVATVQTNDLDLSKPQDVVRLNNRVTYAIKTVCNNADNIFPEAAKEIDECERNTRAQVAQMVSARLTGTQHHVAVR